MYNKKINKLLIGTNNSGKLREIKDLLPKRTKIFSTKYFKLKSPRENGKTFLQNSLIKAKFFSKKTNMICLADDSGLEIDLLKKKPGIFSSRWGGKNQNFNKAILRVFRELYKKDKKWKVKKIKARFICALTIYWPGGKKVKSLGKVEGFISKEKKGNNGFGYDPIFIPKKSKITFGQMKPSKKYKIDHRYNAYKKIKKFF
jgi:XTP/dITP diphosphohydrolase|tara:strand:+ start:1523 stop:2125 length:603 start_codon:yes stop_codon:yes gene_type:complete